jgi:hypothetical protein
MAQASELQWNLFPYDEHSKLYLISYARICFQELGDNAAEENTGEDGSEFNSALSVYRWRPYKMDFVVQRTVV